MADTLATPQDLAALLQVDYASLSAAQVASMTLALELATAKVQRAAGGQRIVSATSTALLDVAPGQTSQYLRLPQMPARSVASVVVDGVAVTDWRLTGGQLWRSRGWGLSCEPVRVAVTYTHGHAAGSQALTLARDAALSLARLIYGNASGVVSEAVDDYRVEYAEADARVEVSEFLRRALLAEYGAGAYVTESR